MQNRIDVQLAKIAHGYKEVCARQPEMVWKKKGLRFFTVGIDLPGINVVAFPMKYWKDVDAKERSRWPWKRRGRA